MAVSIQNAVMYFLVEGLRSAWGGEDRRPRPLCDGRSGLIRAESAVNSLLLFNFVGMTALPLFYLLELSVLRDGRSSPKTVKGPG